MTTRKVASLAWGISPFQALQWGRVDDDAEGFAVVATIRYVGILQWGRVDDDAEGSVWPRAAVRRRRPFNGAASMTTRKAASPSKIRRRGTLQWGRVDDDAEGST